ncbi:MAG: endonuclease/exonuclease/phosphatase family protein [Roseiflexaceae bacterium]
MAAAEQGRFGRQALTRTTAVVAILAVGSYSGPLHWAGDLIALINDTLLWVGVLLLVIGIWQRLWRWSAVALLVVLICGYQLQNYASIPPPAPGERDLRIVVYNLYYQNQTIEQAVAEVKRHNPDLIFLMEYSFDIQAQIEDDFAEYPYRLIQPSRFTMGLAVFSRFPLTSTTIHRAEATRIPIFEVQVDVAGQPLKLVGGHPWAPQPQWAQLHRDQMAEITRVAVQARQSSPIPLIVVGDFNATPWSYTVQQLAEQAEVRHIRRAFDLRKTWYLFPLAGLPIDHVLVSPTLQVIEQQYGDPAGSDHLPIVVDLRLPQPNA